MKQHDIDIKATECVRHVHTHTCTQTQLEFRQQLSIKHTSNRSNHKLTYTKTDAKIEDYPFEEILLHIRDVGMAYDFI